MNITIVNLPEIAIIGKLGFCKGEKNIVPELWNQANANFADVAPLGMKEKDGSFVGFWGAMSDETMSYLPWTDHFSRGYYLAGIEVYKDAVPPDGWTKWIMPSRTYLKVSIDPGKYFEVFQNVIQNQIPEMKMKLSGAACDYTEPATGKNFLFFPVTRI
ncbi:MAG TPA: GyrI-like domain-containing protein [Candidatus Izemoplasmatales bacterium]|nr:GyrI-like domain-containing protein [Candidatus Izemoplasmatales bacterium]